MAVGFLGAAADPGTAPALRWAAIDAADPHYHYLWRAQYDALDGHWIDQLDPDGRALSAGNLDPTRLCRLVFEPAGWRSDARHAPRLEVRAQLIVGERLRTFWQVDHPVDGSPPTIQHVVQLIHGDTATYTFLANDGTVRVGSRANW